MGKFTIADVRTKVEDNRKTIEAQIKDAETIFHRIKDIKTMEELENLIKTTEKRITYMQARIEQNDWFLMDVLVEVEEVELDPSKIFANRREPEPDIVIPKNDSLSYITKYESGDLAITPTVRKRIDMMAPGDTIKAADFIRSLVDMGFVKINSRSGIRKAFEASPNVRRIDYGVYERL